MSEKDSPPDPSAVLARLLADVAELAALFVEMQAILRAHPPSSSGSPAPGPCQDRLTPTERAILRVLGEAGRPLKGVVIAHKCGKTTCSSHFRQSLSQLVARGKVRHTEAGYELPGPGGGRPDAEASGPVG